MSMQNFIDALGIIESTLGRARFAGARAENLVTAAEERLGLKFPPTYREFLLRLGAGNFGTREFYGVIDDDFEDSAIPDGICYTLNERNDGLPLELIVIGATGDGGLYCLDTGQAGEAPVVTYEPPGSAHERVADDFGAFFLEEVRSVASEAQS
jgi:hypothetical protein